METYFLELNSIINLGTRLHTYGKLPSVRTSFWAIMEPMESITPKNYRKIQATLSKIKKSQIYIDWDLPGDKEVKAFCRSVNTCKDQIVKLYNTIITEKEFSKLDDNCIKTIEFLHMIRKSSEEVLRHRSKEDNSSIDKLLLSLMLYVQNITNGNIVNIMGSYDKSLDRYISAMHEMIKLSKKLKVNDFNDIYYFTYLDNNDTYLVSNDKQMMILDSKYKKVINCDEFELRMKIV